MILEVALNLASQILFFIVVVYLIPWLGGNFALKNGDLKKMREKYDKCEDEEKKGEARKADGNIPSFFSYQSGHWKLDL